MIGKDKSIPRCRYPVITNDQGIPEIAKALIYFANRFPGKPAIVAEYIPGDEEYTSYFVFDGSKFQQEQGRNERSSCMGIMGAPWRTQNVF